MLGIWKQLNLRDTLYEKVYSETFIWYSNKRYLLNMILLALSYGEKINSNLLVFYTNNEVTCFKCILKIGHSPSNTSCKF